MSATIQTAAPTRGVLAVSQPEGRLERHRLVPPDDLAGVVHHFWWVRWELRAPFVGEVLAHPSARMLFARWGRVQREELAGVQTTRLTHQLSGEGEHFGITFRPAMFQPLLGADMASVTDRTVALRELFGPGVSKCGTAILAAPGLVEKMALASGFLRARLATIDPMATRWRDVVERMAIDRAMLRVEDACAVAGVNARRLQRGFHEYVGVPPKWVLRRYRMMEAAAQLQSTHPPPLSALAASLGYADQAHFAREFKLTVGSTPGSFARASR